MADVFGGGSSDGREKQGTHNGRHPMLTTSQKSNAAGLRLPLVFAVSLVGPLAAANPAATAVLVGLHGIVAGILIVGLRRTSGAEGGAHGCGIPVRWPGMSPGYRPSTAGSPW